MLSFDGSIVFLMKHNAERSNHQPIFMSRTWEIIVFVFEEKLFDLGLILDQNSDPIPPSSLPFDGHPPFFDSIRKTI